MNFNKQTIDLEALLYALAQQTEPLPEALQRSLTEIGRSLRTNTTAEKANELRQLIKGYEPLEVAYQNSLVELDKRYISQQRTKNSDLTFSSSTGLDILDFRVILSSNNWVNAAKKMIYSQSLQPQRSRFLDRGDRVVTLASGGAFLGVLIAQIPGAIVGGLLAGIYAWFSFPTAKTDGNN